MSGSSPKMHTFFGITLSLVFIILGLLSLRALLRQSEISSVELVLREKKYNVESVANAIGPALNSQDSSRLLVALGGVTYDPNYEFYALYDDKQNLILSNGMVPSWAKPESNQLNLSFSIRQPNTQSIKTGAQVFSTGTTGVKTYTLVIGHSQNCFKPVGPSSIIKIATFFFFGLSMLCLLYSSVALINHSRQSP